MYLPPNILEFFVYSTIGIAGWTFNREQEAIKARERTQNKAICELTSSVAELTKNMSDMQRQLHGVTVTCVDSQLEPRLRAVEQNYIPRTSFDAAIQKLENQIQDLRTDLTQSQEVEFQRLHTTLSQRLEVITDLLKPAISSRVSKD
jgi:ribosome-associated translation inhibitor RaiA